MKKLILILLVLLVYLTPVWALAPSAGTVTSQSHKTVGRDANIKIWQVGYTTHVSAGTFTLVTDQDINGWILLVETDPGSTAPTPDYDITIKNDNGYDLMGGALTNRHTTATERTRPLIGSVYEPVETVGKLTISVSAAGNSKTAEIIIYYLPF